MVDLGSGRQLMKQPVGRVEQRETRRYKFARALRIICLDMLGFTSFYPTYELRKQAAEEFKALSGAARNAGVQDKMFGVFHDAGYKGMYGGLGRDSIKKHKSIHEKENLMDRMNTTELAANQFRMTQTRDKLANDKVKDQQGAIKTHEIVGTEVRDAIRRIGGTLPEQLPPAEHIKYVEKRIKSTAPKLELEEKDAKGLIGAPEEDI
jgi:DNA-damage-inducible protein D